MVQVQITFLTHSKICASPRRELLALTLSLEISVGTVHSVNIY